MSGTKVFIILVNWNGKEDTAACLRSLKNINYPNYEIILVDNGSTDNSYDYLKTHFPQITLIENKENLGFAGGCNLGIKHALENGTEYVLLLNNDTIVKEDFLDKLVTSAEKEKADLATGKIYYYGRAEIIWGAGGLISLQRGMGCFFGINQKDCGQFDVKKTVTFISGCMMLIRREVFEKIGILDDTYFMYCEDVDFCLRALEENLKLLYIPTSVIWHKKIAATNINHTPFRFYYFVRNSTFIVKKFANTKQKVIYYFFYLPLTLFKQFYTIKDVNLKIISAFFLGIYDSFCNNKGEKKSWLPPKELKSV